MFGVGTRGGFQLQWRGNLSEYVTAVAWSPDRGLAASSAAGEVVLWQDGGLVTLLPAGVASVDCLAFSADGRFLAAGGQDGQVRVWSISTVERKEGVELITTLNNAPKWIDKLSWHPTCHQLAFSLGRYVQIWEADTQTVVSTLPFTNSSVLDLTWQPNGANLAIAGNGGVKVWNARDWNDDPYSVDMPSASTVTAWSPDNKYLASGNLDHTITVLEYGLPIPWVMQGFPGKISNLIWSPSLSNNALLAASSVEGIAVWKKEANDRDGWNARILDRHDGKIQALAFHPNRLLLASAGDDGRLCLWTKAKQIGQILEGAPGGFACLAWNREGKLAAGGQNGELVVWSESKRGKGFA